MRSNTEDFLLKMFRDLGVTNPKIEFSDDKDEERFKIVGNSGTIYSVMACDNVFSVYETTVEEQEQQRMNELEKFMHNSGVNESDLRKMLARLEEERKEQEDD